MPERIYTVFKRSARNWEEFSAARRTVIRKNLTLGEAQQLCRNYNKELSERQINRGTKYEFTL